VKWYAARVVTGREYDLKKKIKVSLSECEVYIPRQLVTDVVNGKIAQRTEKLVPGYIFIGTEKELPVQVIDGFIQIIGTVTDEEMDHLRELEYVESSDAAPLAGQKIIVNDGPLMGCKGTVVVWEGDMAKCKLIFQGMEINAAMKKEYINSIR